MKVLLAPLVLLALLAASPACAREDWSGECPGWGGRWSDECRLGWDHGHADYRGSVSPDGGVSLHNEQGDVLRGQVYPDGWVSLRDSGGDLYRGVMEPGGRLKARDAHGNEVRGRAALP